DTVGRDPVTESNEEIVTVNGETSKKRTHGPIPCVVESVAIAYLFVIVAIIPDNAIRSGLLFLCATRRLALANCAYTHAASGYELLITPGTDCLLLSEIIDQPLVTLQLQTQHARHFHCGVQAFGNP